MAKYQFTARLSTDSLNNLKKELLNYKDNILRNKIDLLLKALADEGVQIAQGNIASLDAIFTGELFNSIKAVNGGRTQNTAIFYIVADNQHAAFVEFGTGQIGKENPYPYPLPDGVEWNYNTGKTIFEIAPGKYGWFYPRDGKWYFTQGMPSRPFMFETSLQLQTLIIKKAKEVFG